MQIERESLSDALGYNTDPPLFRPGIALMPGVLHSLFWWFVRLAFRFRYRVQIDGLEKLRGLRGPTIVMPNHPGYVDPPLVLSHVRLPRPLRPLAISYIYRNPVLYPVMRLIDAFEVPDLEEHSRKSHERTVALIDAVAERLRQGDCFLMYPSGRLQRGQGEVLGAARAAADLLARCPEANVVLVRTRGVWGSMFSAARTGKTPHLSRCVLVAAGWVMANLGVFLPRRRVHITIDVLDRATLPEMKRETLNPLLEAWYNEGGVEEPTFVPYHYLFGSRRYAFPPLDARAVYDPEKIKPATRTAVNEMVEERLQRSLDADERQADVTLDRLGLDSLDRMDIALAIEQRFGFRSDRVAVTLGELWALAGGLMTGTADAPTRAAAGWEKKPTGDDPPALLGDTMAEALVRRALKHPDDVALADPLTGVMSYRRFLVAATLMSRRFGPLEGEAVGMLLPASAASDMVFFGLHLAGKLPVILNWTTGPVNLQHAVDTLSVRRVITSRKFIDRFGIELAGVEYVYLEDLRASIGKLEALRALASTYLAPGSILRRVPKPDVDRPAVVLFTSGSEAAPKAVPLSHGNLLANVRASLQIVHFERSDAVLGFLPPFHSFGLMGNVVMPLLTGVRLVHHPDPTDARGLVRAAARYGTNMVFSTPTFLNYMLAVAQPEDLRTLRLAVTGAERCPDALFERFAEMVPGIEIIEGYGITECSPIVAANPQGHVKRGTVGKPIRGVEVVVVDPETGVPLETGRTGMLLVRGPSVFLGYLHYDGPSPFVECQGKSWYRTGDLVELDDEGYIHFRGRLKRFLKAGGEMISLPALEEPLARLFPPTENGPQVAVEGIETHDGRWIVLFTTRDLSLREANAILSQAGFRGVMRLDAVRQMESIPILGTGKTDYKVLRKLLA